MSFFFFLFLFLIIATDTPIKCKPRKLTKEEKIIAEAFIRYWIYSILYGIILIMTVYLLLSIE